MGLGQVGRPDDLDRPAPPYHRSATPASSRGWGR